jgi:predicted kinase
VQWRSAYATTAGAFQDVVPPQARTAPGRSRRIRPDRALDLRRGEHGSGGAGHGPDGVRTLHYPAGDVLVVSGLPGSGKSTLIKRAVSCSPTVRRIDSQDVRERYEQRMPGWLPYAVYRPVVRAAHYHGLLVAVRSGESLVVHDCGSIAWVRLWLARRARREGRGMHLLLLDVPPRVAAEGQCARGRRVSAYAFSRHRRASRRLIGAAEEVARGPAGPAGTVKGRAPRRTALPKGCVSAVLLDRPAARALREIRFGD